MRTKKQIRFDFRSGVFERAGYRCEVCGVVGHDRQGTVGPPGGAALDAHHICDRHTMPNGGYVMENGIALCDECHGCAERGEYPGFTKHELFERIGSDYEKALAASGRLGVVKKGRP